MSLCVACQTRFWFHDMIPSLSSSLVYDLVSEVFGVSKGNVSVNVSVNVNVNANANTNTNVNANGSPHQVPASTLMARHN